MTKRKGTAKGAAARPSSSPQAAPAAPADGGGPDDSWTVADLRAEAKKRGVTGYSRMTKGDLLAALRR